MLWEKTGHPSQLTLLITIHCCHAPAPPRAMGVHHEGPWRWVLDSKDSENGDRRERLFGRLDVANKVRGDELLIHFALSLYSLSAPGI